MRHLRTALGFALSAALLWWTLRDVAPATVWDVLRASDGWLLAACTVVGTLIFPLRARRWRPILAPATGALALGPLWRSTAIGMMINNVAPLRAGEFARAYALTREVPHVPLTTALGSLAVDRLFDALVVFIMMFAAMLDPRFPADARVAGRTIPELAAGGLVVISAALAIAYTVVLSPEHVLRLIRRVTDRLIPRHAERITTLARQGIRSLGVLREGRQFVAVLLWTAAHWGTHALALYLGFLAVGIQIPLSAAFFLQGVLAIGVAVPSSPGFFGVFEAAATIGLAVYGVPPALAVSWALGYHLLTFVPITMFGAMYFARLGLSLGGVQGARRRSAE